MNKREFLKELESIKDHFECRTIRNIYLHYHGDWNNMCIRGYQDSKCFCPITAVCYAKTGVYYVPQWYRLAAREIDLAMNSAKSIVIAADQDSLEIRKAVGLT